MIYADTLQEVQKRRKAILREWWLRQPAVVNILEEAGDRLFTFTTLPPFQPHSRQHYCVCVCVDGSLSIRTMNPPNLKFGNGMTTDVMVIGRDK